MWTNFLSNKKPWTSIFGETNISPTLNISYAIFRGSSILLKISSPMQGSEYPKKWLNLGYNTYEFDLLFSNIKRIEITDFNFSGPANLSVKKMVKTMK